MLWFPFVKHLAYASLLQLWLYMLLQKRTQNFVDRRIYRCYDKSSIKKGGDLMKLGGNLQYLRKLHGNMTQ